MAYLPPYQQSSAEHRQAEKAQVDRLKQFKAQQEAADRRRREERERALIAEQRRRAAETSQRRK